MATARRTIAPCVVVCFQYNDTHAVQYLISQQLDTPYSLSLFTPLSLFTGQRVYFRGRTKKNHGGVYRRTVLHGMGGEHPIKSCDSYRCRTRGPMIVYHGPIKCGAQILAALLRAVAPLNWPNCLMYRGRRLQRKYIACYSIDCLPYNVQIM